MSNTVENLTIENAKLLFRNFAGAATKFNAAGNRNFCVLIEDADAAERLINSGWNVRILAPRNEEEEPRYYLPVAFSYANFPPKIYMISNGVKTLLEEDVVASLDYADIRSVDLIIRPYNWRLYEGTPKETSGVKAYLKTMYVVIEDDPFYSKYDETPTPGSTPWGE